MKVRSGFVSNSSSSSFILNMQTNKHFGDTDANVYQCWGYFKDRKWLESNIPNCFEDDVFDDVKIETTWSENSGGYFFGLKVSEFSTPELVKAELSKRLKMVLDTDPELFLVGSVGE